MNKKKKIIARRNLYYSVKGKNDLIPFSIEVGTVYKDLKKIKGSECYACDITFLGLDEKSLIKYGMDSIQVLNMATNLEPLLKRISKEYDLFWEDEAPYF